MAQERILVVDDKIEIVTFLNDLLQPLGYAVSFATDGKSALARALQEQPDLILLDLHMPGMSGVEVLEELYRHNCRVPVIMMTLYGSESVVIQALRLGVRDYVPKPFDIDELLAAIEQALEKARLQRERERLVCELRKTNAQLTRRMQELAALQAIGRSVASLMPLQELLRRIVDAAIYLSDADAGALFLRDETDGRLYLEAIRQGDVYRSDLQTRICDSHADDVLRSGKCLWVPRPTKHTGVTGYLGEQAHSLLYVPVKLGGLAVGVIGVAYLQGKQDPPTEAQKRLIALADYAAIALQNAQLYHKLRQRVEQLATVNRIARMTASSLELKEVIRTVVEEIKNSLHAETVSLLLPDREEISLRRDPGQPLCQQIRQQVVNWVIQHRQALRIDDLTQDPRFYAGADETGDLYPHSILCVPLTVSDQAIGAIVACNRLDNRLTGGREPFTNQDEELLQGVAAFVAMAVENARLHEAARETTAIQAIQQTIVTLSHYLNNSLQTLMGISELLKPEMDDHRSTAEAGWVIKQEVHKIAAVLSVLRDIASPESTVYFGATQMLDIEQELQARLASTIAPLWS